MTKRKTKPKSKKKVKSKATSELAKLREKQRKEIEALKNRQYKDKKRAEKLRLSEAKKLKRKQVLANKKAKREAHERRIVAKRKRQEDANSKKAQKLEQEYLKLTGRKLEHTPHTPYVGRRTKPKRSRFAKLPAQVIRGTDGGLYRNGKALSDSEALDFLVNVEKHVAGGNYCTRCHYTPCKRLEKYPFFAPLFVPNRHNQSRRPNRLDPKPLDPTTKDDWDNQTNAIKKCLAVGGIPHHKWRTFMDHALWCRETHKTLKKIKNPSKKQLEWMKTGNLEKGKEGQPVLMNEHFSVRGRQTGGLSMAGYIHHWKRENPNRTPVSDKHKTYGKFPCPSCFPEEAIAESEKNASWSLDPYEEQLLEQQTGMKLVKRTAYQDGERDETSAEANRMPLYSWIQFSSLKTDWLPQNTEKIRTLRAAGQEVPEDMAERIPVMKNGKQDKTNVGTLYERAMRNFNQKKDWAKKKIETSEVRLHRYPTGIHSDKSGEIAQSGYFCGDCGVKIDTRFCKHCGKDSGIERYMTEDEIAESVRQDKLRQQAVREYEADKDKRKKKSMSKKDKDIIKDYKKQLRGEDKK